MTELLVKLTRLHLLAAEYTVFFGVVLHDRVDACRAYAPYKIEALVVVGVQAVGEALSGGGVT